MIKHHILLAIRNFQRSKSEFLINVVGLTAGLTGFILICLWINDEFAVDQFHDHGARLFQVMEHQRQQGDWWTHSNTDGYLASNLMSEFAEVQNGVASSRA